MFIAITKKDLYQEMYVNFLLTGFCSRMTYVWCLRYLIFKLGIVWFSFFFQMLMKPKLNAAAKTDKQYAMFHVN